MKIFFNRPIKKEAWGGGSHFITNLYRYLCNKNIEVTFTLDEDINLIFMFEPRTDGAHPGIREILKFKHSNNIKIPIIQRINDTDIARHAYGLSPHDPPWRIKTLLHANQFVDHTIFISKWVKRHYEDHGYKKNSRDDSVIINGCNLNYFYPKKSDDKKSDVLKVITHHWSDNPMKGLDVYMAMDEICKRNPNIEFTYLGRYPKSYKPTATKILSPTYGVEIGKILRQNDVYITGARFEACGMHHIEAAACGLPVIFHKDGGAINEICEKYGTSISDYKELESSLNFYSNKINRQKKINNINYEFLSDERCNSQYYECILSLINKKKV